jgi:hypothetical protein
MKFLLLISLFLVVPAEASWENCWVILRAVVSGRSPRLALQDHEVQKARNLVQPWVAHLIPAKESPAISLADRDKVVCRINPYSATMRMPASFASLPARIFQAFYIHEFGHYLVSRGKFLTTQEKAFAEKEPAFQKYEDLRLDYAEKKENLKILEDTLRISPFESDSLRLSQARDSLKVQVRQIKSRLEKLAREINSTRMTRPPPEETWLRVGAEELFCDLLACTALEDGDAISRAIVGGFGSFKLASFRENLPGKIPQTKNAIRFPLGPSLDYFPTEYEDPHHTLRWARQFIWDQYLKGKPKEEQIKAIDALIAVHKIWPSHAKKIINVDAGFLSTDVNLLNRNFLSLFEKTIKEMP